MNPPDPLPPARSLDVLFVLPSLEQGGAERVTINLANALLASGHRPRILLSDRPGSLAAQLDPAVPIDAIDRPRVRAALPQIVRRVRSAPPDVLLATHTHLSLALCAIQPLLPTAVRLVVREPTHAPHRIDGRTTRWRRLAQRVLYRRADLVLATSAPMQLDLRTLTRTRVELLPNPVDTATIHASLRTVQKRRDERTEGEGRRLVSVGRLSTQKSLPDLIRAFAAASDPADRLVLIGEGPLRSELLELGRSLGIADRLELLGFLAQPWPEIAAADALVLASREEGMPNVVLESLAVGTPVIATDDLDVLREVRDAAPADAVRLVPRGELADAIRAVTPRPTRSPAGGEHRDVATENLLPSRYEVAESGQRLVALLDDGPAADATRRSPA